MFANGHHFAFLGNNQIENGALTARAALAFIAVPWVLWVHWDQVFWLCVDDDEGALLKPNTNDHFK